MEIPAGLVGALTHLRCPVCAAALAADAGTLRCEHQHAFDVARQGHVTLLGPGARMPAGDNAEMVAAREAFLGTGHYELIAEAVAEQAALVNVPGCIVEVGAGTAYYLAHALTTADGSQATSPGATVIAGETGRTATADAADAAATATADAADAAATDAVDDAVATSGAARTASPRAGIALDSSRHALRRAARAHERIGAVVADAWAPLPLRDGTAAVVLCVFAPRNGPELRRVLAPGGSLIVVTPTPKHLAELVATFGLVSVDVRKRERLARALGEPSAEQIVESELELSRNDVRALIAMGPSAHHVDADKVARSARATLSVRVATYTGTSTD